MSGVGISRRKAASSASVAPERLKIGEVARRAGVAPSVITYYLSEGLLPKPVKTSRNMAYYDVVTVEWVTLIRELQESSFLPLRVIKKLVASGSSPAQIRESFVARNRTVTSSEVEVEEKVLLERTSLTRKDLRKLEELEVLTPKKTKGRRVYSIDDVSIVEQLAQMRDAGLTAERGFGVEQMAIYRNAMERLVEKEVEFAVAGIAGSMGGEDVAKVAKVWVRGANEIIRALHNKFIKRAVRQLSEGMKGSP